MGAVSRGYWAPGPQGKPHPSRGVLVGGRFLSSCLMRALHACKPPQAARSAGCSHPHLAPCGLAWLGALMGMHPGQSVVGTQ